MAALWCRILTLVLLIAARESQIKEIRFDDNSVFEDYELLNAISSSVGDLYSEQKVEADADSIVAHYASYGFEGSKVKTEYSRWLGRLVFTVREGKGPTTQRIRFKGKTYFRANRLTGVIASEKKGLYNPDRVKSDSVLLLTYYQNQGFFDATVNSKYEQSRRRLTFHIQKGPRTKIENIEIIGAPSGDTGWIFRHVPLRKHSPLTSLGLTETKRITKRFYQNKGYPNVVVDLDTKIHDTYADLIISVVPGRKNWISSVSFTGIDPREIHPDFLMQTTRLKPGEVFSISRIDRAGSLLYSTYLFQRVSDSIMVNKNDSTDIVFILVPAKYRAFVFGAGLQTPTASTRDEMEPANKLLSALTPDRLFLSLGWEHMNLFHRGVTFSSELSFSPTFRGNYEVGLNLRNRYPNFLPWGLIFTVSPFWEHGLTRNEDKQLIKRFHTLGMEIGVERIFSEKFQAGLTMQLKRTWDTIGIDTSFAEINQTNFVRASMSYDSRNDFFSPSEGILLYPYLDWAGSPFGGDNHFFRFAVDFRNYLGLPANVVVAWRVNGGIIVPHSGQTIEDIHYGEKFNLGGMGSVRAVAPRSVGPDSVFADSVFNSNTNSYELIYDYYGTFMSVLSFEIRSPYIRDFLGFVMFFDAGVCSRSPTLISDGESTWGPGIGIRIKTPIGPIRMDYAKNANEPFDTGDILLGGRIELGFAQAF